MGVLLGELGLELDNCSILRGWYNILFLVFFWFEFCFGWLIYVLRKFGCLGVWFAPISLF